MTYKQGPDGTLIRIPTEPAERIDSAHEIPLDADGRPDFSSYLPRGPKPERPLSSSEVNRPPSPVARTPRQRAPQHQQPAYDPALLTGEEPPDYGVQNLTPPLSPQAQRFPPDPLPSTTATTNGPVRPTPGREHLQRPPGQKLRCGDLVFLRMHTKRYAMECELETEQDGHPNQPHMARLQEVETGDEIFLGWRHADEQQPT